MESPTVRKTFKYTRQPTAEQEGTMEFVLRRCRELYTAALEERWEAWRMGQVSITVAGQSAQLPDSKQERPEYQDIHSQVVQDVLTRLDRAFQAFFQAFFRRVTTGETPGYPRFKPGFRYDSFTYKQFGNGATVDNGFLVLSKIGRIAVRWSRPLEGTPKTVTMRRAADGWYVGLSCAEVPAQPLPLTGQETGIDLGLESFATLADGSQVPNPRIFRVAEMNLKRAQRRVSRRVTGSHRRRKAGKLLAKAHQTVRQYDTIYHEEVQPANLVQHHPRATSIRDAGWSGFLSILSFKAVAAGKTVVAVPAAFTAQACSGCGGLVHKGLSVRGHACPDCGTSLHRDHNAARNILARGQAERAAGPAVQALTWAVGPSVA
jgi:putative transposase